MNSTRTLFPVLCVVICIAIQAKGQEVFFGNLHSHTGYSDGAGTPAEAYTYARYTAGLDFLAITEHSHKRAGEIAENPELYRGEGPDSLISAANEMTSPGKFVALYGQEWSTINSGNHVNVFDAPDVITARNGMFDELVNWLEKPGHRDTTGQTCIVQFNHPYLYSNNSREYGRDDFGGKAKWLREIDGVTSLLEIINGPSKTEVPNHDGRKVSEGDYQAILNLGFHVAPTADQDNHRRTWGTATRARTAIVAANLTKENLLNAMRKRHVYATEDKNLKIVCRVNGRLCGDIIEPAPPAGRELKIEFTIRDGDEREASYEVQVFRDRIGGKKAGAPIDTYTIETSGDDDADQVWVIEDVTYTGGREYIFFKFIQVDEDGDRDNVWTAPVWFEPGSDNPERFVALRFSNIYHGSSDCSWVKDVKEGNDERFNGDDMVHGREASEGRRLHRGCPDLGTRFSE